MRAWYARLAKPYRAILWSAYGALLWGVPWFFGMSWFTRLMGHDTSEHRSVLLLASLVGGMLWGVGMWFVIERKVARLGKGGRV
jgi:arginine exporter protein ArgO